MTVQTMIAQSQDLDNFLYSVVREEEGGDCLTVRSVLARHDFDPWEAAEGLARLPRNVASAKLSLLIATHSGDHAGPGSDDAIAIELLGKLRTRRCRRRAGNRSP